MRNMHEAVKEDGLAEVKLAFALDADSVNELDENDHPPLYTAALYGNQAAVLFLLEHGAHCDLFACAYLNLLDDGEALLLRASSSARLTTRVGMTALHYAARAGNEAMARLLIDHGANVNSQDMHGTTALLEACHTGPWKREPAMALIDLLVSHGAIWDLHSKAAVGRVEGMDAWLDDWSKTPECTLNDLNPQGQTALLLAAKNNHFEMVQLLVQRGADIQLCDVVGIAALHRTSQQCSDTLIQFLIERGAKASACCYAACGDEAGLRKAIGRNPDAAFEVRYGYHAVQYAIHSWQLGTLRVLLKHGCRLSSEDQKHILRISRDDHALLRDLMTR